MVTIAAASERVRTEGWLTNLTAYPVTLPSRIEYELVLLPSPFYGVSKSSSALDEFMSALTGLISKYAQDPALLMNFDKFAPILEEVSLTDKVDCALLLENNCSDGHQMSSPVERWVRVKLAAMLLHGAERNTQLDKNAMEMIERWKKSDIDVIRQIGWEWE